MLKRLFSLLKFPLKIRNNAKDSITDAGDKCTANTSTGNRTETVDNIFINRMRVHGFRERRGCKGIWQIKVNDFYDAFRIAMRLCFPGQVIAENINGNVDCKFVSDNGCSTVLLQCKNSRNGIVAVLRPSPGYLSDIKEVRFYRKL